MIKYTLTSPTFELALTDLKVIVKMFEDCVCDECKVTQEYAVELVENWYESDYLLNPLNRVQYFNDMQIALDESLPDNYNDLTDEEKINILPNTQCGAEFIFETVEDLEVV